ncbi:type VII secretion-associated serine protease mycosin [Streptomyces hoynatensis]|uniref:type VII secretion-associated serine protease mycosin n=1 Tax=Streptomyces hoynatensis TaxID=1141874 RepID=UPI001319E02B|nr:type VII secretion-associated serine protease mycosin [Streptomyces hoynatensis]
MASTLPGLLTAPAASAEDVHDPWYMDTLRVEEMWQQTRGEGVTVAVIDTGVDDSLPELAGKVVGGTDLTFGAEGPTVDEAGHGTNMAALIAGTGEGGGVRGLAPDVDLISIRVGERDGQVDFDLDARMAEAIQYAAESGAQVINISWGKVEDGVDVEAISEAIAEAARQGALIFAASGNDGDTENSSFFPADRDGVVAVGAVDRNGRVSHYSTHGPQLALAAPADDVPSHCPDAPGGLCLDPEGGTSSASALASASAALIWSAHPDWTKNQVLRVMMETADGPEGHERDDYIGYGMVRPDRVILDGEGEPGRPDTSPLFPSYEASLDPPATPEPTAPEPGADEGEGSSPAPGAAASEGAEQTVASSSDGSDGSGAGPWVLFGLAGAVLMGGTVTAVLLSRRRATTL